MSLTNRRKQFLQKLIELYEKSELPVHYETLAKSIGVSKWTAYDMLKQLEKMGLLKKDYIVNGSDTGRSQLVYSPTEKTYKIFNESLYQSISEEEWTQVKIKLHNILKGLEQEFNPSVISGILENISNTNNKVVLGANVISLLITYLKLSNESKIPNVISLISLIEENNTKLALFIGTILGMFLTETNKLGIEVMSLDIV